MESWTPQQARLVGLARSFGPLRAVNDAQAPVVRAAAELDRTVVPRWQRFGDGVHEWVHPQAYARGRTWVRLATPVVDLSGRKQWRGEVWTGRAHLAWATRRHWLEVVVPEAVRAHPEALHTRRGTVKPDKLLLWARTISLHAHERTGRRCIVRVDRLAELMGVSKSTVQRCQAAAEALGIYVVLSPGRMLTETETYTARSQGSYQRGLANDAALVVPRDLASTLPDTPTSGRYRNLKKVPVSSSFSTQQRFAGEAEPPPAARSHLETRDQPAQPGSDRPSKAPQRPPGPAGRPPGRSYDPEALQLARSLSDVLPWLAGVPAGRLEPALRRFVRCRQPWTAHDVTAAIDQVNTRLGRASMTRDLVRQPWALLAAYLRGLDPDADHPRHDPYFDPTTAPELVSRTRYRNRVLIEINRASPAGTTPGHADAAIAAIRDDLAHRRDRRHKQLGEGQD